MRLKLFLPTEILIDEPVTKVIAEAENGCFCLLPHHVDFVTALVPAILYYTTDAGIEQFVAVDEGTLVKCGDEVLVSTLNAASGSDLERLQVFVAETFRNLEEEERRARTSLARLEAGTLRRFLELEKKIHA